ncbi:MarR family transcriptional regulator [Halobacillus salinarum]|uniref:HTH-type transcriptional regulator MgrA n=1 Tax=Halobacillus salinarum TaxID=2932257 RepID=A0ABY4EKJ5_9BACI|nr:MarR family transcriptional regulator [Halobacillus salinarum]UOQ44992.1 MarR family transcriptional regulator [Halobacillus salinarum]
MTDFDNLEDLFFNHIEKLFFPEEWLKLDLKFSKSEILTMLYLYKRKEITMREIVEYLNSPMSTATGIADRLVKNGFIHRCRSEHDRRIVILKLSEKGTGLVKEIMNMVSSYVNVVLDNLTEEEKQFLTQIVLKIISSVQKKLSEDHVQPEDNHSIKKIEIE